MAYQYPHLGQSTFKKICLSIVGPSMCFGDEIKFLPYIQHPTWDTSISILTRLNAK
jgi:hypothetical protein